MRLAEIRQQFKDEFGLIEVTKTAADATEIVVRKRACTLHRPGRDP